MNTSDNTTYFALPHKPTARAWPSRTCQWMGSIAVAIFAWRLVQYLSVNTWDWIMYSCHVSTLAFGLAMVFGWPLMVRVTVIWLVIGLPMWIIDAWVMQVIWIASVFSHVVGFLLAWYAIRKVRATGRAWPYALLWFVTLQLITRYTTRPDLNVNIAHFPYEAFKNTYSNYWSFWLVCTLVVALMVGLVEFGLVRMFPVAAHAGERNR
jgi:hypothetical protein